MTEKTLPESVSSVLKVFNILQTLGENKKCGVSELAQRLMMSKAKTTHFLETMITLGYVIKEDDEYSLTLKLFELGTKPLEYMELDDIADKEMTLISEVTGEAIHLGVIEGDSFVHTHKIDARYNLRTHSDIGRPRPLYSTAIGKMLLSGMKNEYVRKILKDVEFVKYTPNTMQSIEQVIDALESIRLNHYSEGIEEQESGVRCIAAPIYDRLGNIVAGLSISFPVVRFEEEKKSYVIELLHKSCQNVSEQLGFYQYPVSIESETIQH